MYVGKRTKSILAVLLICGLLVVSIPGRAYAVGPVVLGPALKYAIGAGLVAGGLYAENKDAINYVINDYWDKASNHVKNQWNSAVIYGTGIGIIVLNDPLRQSLHEYLNDNFSPGYNTVTEPGPVNPSDGRFKSFVDVNGVTYDLLYYDPDSTTTYNATFVIISDDPVRNAIKAWRDNEANRAAALQSYLYVVGNDLYGKWFTASSSGSNVVRYGVAGAGSVGYGEGVDYGYYGDSVGFGSARPGEDVKIPCPPVPAAEWPDQWLDDLQDEMNRTGNPTLDDETSIEEWEDEWEWYMDELGNIYKVKKGQPPREPDDEPIRIPGPPLPAPDVPENYPTEDDPDITIEHHPPQTTITENPDGSRTEITTQTTTTTRRWWDPTAKRWRTTIDETTTTTTVDYAPDGTETGRTTTTTTQPKGEREETAQPDDTAIDWEPLKRGLYELTEKFPFCLPWDLMRGIQSLESSQWDRKIRIDVGDGIWPAMVIDLTMFDGIASITRVVLLIIFDLGLIFGTRKLMGGDV